MAEEKKVAAKKTTSSTSKKTTTTKKVATKKATAEVAADVKVEKEVKEAVKKPTKKVAKKVSEKPAPAKVEEKAKKSSKKEEVKLIPPTTEAKATALNVRVTPRKARLVIDLVRGKSVIEAIAILSNLRKSAATPVLKVIKSAAANATNNFNLDDEKLYVKEIYACDGLKMKRYMPRAKGSASGLVKRTAHITCVVKER